MLLRVRWKPAPQPESLGQKTRRELRVRRHDPNLCDARADHADYGSSVHRVPAASLVT
jgi:hypothetical protein